MFVQLLANSRPSLNYIGSCSSNMQILPYKIGRLNCTTEEEWGSSHNALRLVIIHNYDFQRTFGEKLLKYIAILVPFISFFRRYVFIFVLFKTLIRP
jgi:hypothetical protein